MTERVMSGDGSPACPFIAFDDERDERSSSPDHRHRCYAEVRPAPRALAHQEAYCLSSAFPVCPTFQDWARREAAHERSGRAASAPAAKVTGPRSGGEIPLVVPAVASAASTPPADDDDADAPDNAPPIWQPGPEDDAVPQHDPETWSGDPQDDGDPVIHRNPPRDWAAPPPWATGGGPGGRPADGDDGTPAFLGGRPASQGLAGSAADRMASGLPVGSPSSTSTPSSKVPDSDDLAGLVAPTRPQRGADPRAQPLIGRGPVPRTPAGRPPAPSAPGKRPAVSSTRDRSAPVASAADHDGPSWERARRYEAYPTIKTRTGLPGIPRLALLAGALGVAALALFFLPALLGLGGGGSSPSPSPTGSSSASASNSASPSFTPAPTSSITTYVIKKGDTLNKIAKKFGLTVDQILAANKDTIKDANKITQGLTIVIPIAPTDVVTDPNASNPRSASPSPT